MTPALPTIFVVVHRIDYEGIVALLSAHPTEPEANEAAGKVKVSIGYAEVMEVPMVSKDCSECGKPFATEADVDAAYTSHMDGSGICWHGKGSAYGTDGCRNTKA